MKKFMKVLSLVLALGLILGLTVTASAEETLKVSAGTADEITRAISDADGKDLEITLTDDIEEILEIITEKDQTITLKGNVSVHATYLRGNGTVNLEVTKLGGSNTSPLLVRGDVVANICGDISADSSNSDTLVTVFENAKVEITGDITASTLQSSSAQASSAVYASGNASVTVKGNVKGGDGIAEDPEIGYVDGGYGVNAEGKAKVKVFGDVTAGNSNGYYSYAAAALIVSGEATVEVIGNVYGGTATELNGYDYSGEVVEAAGHGIYLDSSMGGAPTVKVTGNVFGGKIEDEAFIGGSGIFVDAPYREATSASVTVYGDVTGTGQFPGIFVPASSNFDVYVDGTVTGGEDSVTPLVFSYVPAQGPIQEIRQFPTYEEALLAYPEMAYWDYIQMMFMALDYLDASSKLSEEDLMPFEILMLRAALRTVDITLPDPFDPENEEHEQILQNALESLGGATEEAIAAELQKDDAKIYAEFTKLVNKTLVPDVETIPNITVWALTANEEGEVCNAPEYLPYVKYIIRVNDIAGGTLKASKGYADSQKIDVILATPNAGYKLEKIAANKGALTGGKVSWNYRTPADDYTGGIVVSATFKQTAAGDGPVIDGSSGIPNPPTGDSETMIFAAMATMTALVGFCLIHLVRIRKNEQ